MCLLQGVWMWWVKTHLDHISERFFPDMIVSTEMVLTVMSSASVTNRHTWQDLESQSWGFLEWKSLGMFTSPLIWWSLTLNSASVDKNVATLALVENSPLDIFYQNWTHGLLSVRIWVVLWDSRMKGAKCCIEDAILNASNSHGSQRLWWDFNLALKNPPISKFASHFTNITDPIPTREPSWVMISWSSGVGVVIHEVDFKAVWA